MDTAKERVHLRCHFCRRIRAEYGRQQLYDISTLKTYTFEVNCRDCDRTTSFVKEKAVEWLIAIDEYRKKTLYASDHFYKNSLYAGRPPYRHEDIVKITGYVT